MVAPGGPAFRRLWRVPQFRHSRILSAALPDCQLASLRCGSPRSAALWLPRLNSRTPVWREAELSAASPREPVPAPFSKPVLLRSMSSRDGAGGRIPRLPVTAAERLSPVAQAGGPGRLGHAKAGSRWVRRNGLLSRSLAACGGALRSCRGGCHAGVPRDCALLNPAATQPPRPIARRAAWPHARG